jgi:hypothetical protein
VQVVTYDGTFGSVSCKHEDYIYIYIYIYNAIGKCDGISDSGNCKCGGLLDSVNCKYAEIFDGVHCRHDRNILYFELQA